MQIIIIMSRRNDYLNNAPEEQWGDPDGCGIGCVDNLLALLGILFIIILLLFVIFS